MLLKFLIVNVDSNYCDFLRKYDTKVPYNKANKETRPFIGVLFWIGDIEYFAPLSSPKAKHIKMRNTIDFVKIDGGKLGAINFNNMIPVKPNNYKIVDLNKKNLSKEDNEYQDLLKDQLTWLNKNRLQILFKADRLYDYYLANLLPDNIKNRCCNFKLLEEKCEEYNKNIVNT